MLSFINRNGNFVVVCGNNLLFLFIFVLFFYWKNKMNF